MNTTKRLHSRVSAAAINRRQLVLTPALVGGSSLIASLLGSAMTAQGVSARQDGATAGEIVVGIDTDPITLDPRAYSATQAYWTAHHVIEPLVFRDEQMQTIPYLAESWEQVEPTRLRMKLRAGVTFHDGQPLTSQDVKYTLESTLDESLTFVNPQKRGFLAALQSVEIVDDLTFDIVTKTPSRPLLRNLASVTQIIPASAAAAGETFGVNPIGTGPYKLVEYAPGSHLTLEANPNYWGQAPATPRLTMQFIAEAGTRVAALQSGDVVMINNVPPDSIQSLDESEDFAVLSADATRIVFFQLAYDRAPFNDRRVRAAINHAIDRVGIVEAIMQNHATVATSVMASSIPGFNDALPQDDYTYDPELAKSLLAEAGFADGLTISFGYPSGRYLNDRQVAEAVMGQLEQVGITCNSDSPEWGTYFNGLLAQQYDASMLAYASLPVDADWALNWLFNSATSIMKYSNPEVDALLQQGLEVFDEAAVADVYRQAQAAIWADIPWIPLYVQQEVAATSAKLSGFAPRADEYSIFTQATLSEG